MLITIAGTFFNDEKGCQRGQVRELPDDVAKQYIKSGYCQANWRDKPGPPYAEQRHVMDGWTRS